MPQNTTKDNTQTAKDAVKADLFSIGFITPLTTASRAGDLFRVVEPLSALNFKLSVLAEGEEAHQKELFKLSEAYSDNLEVLESVNQNKQEIISQAQVVIFMTAPSDDDLLFLAKNNVIAIIPSDNKNKELINFDAQKEVGNCFVYDPNNFWDFLATILRAYETYKFPYDWSQCKKSFKKLMGL